LKLDPENKGLNQFDPANKGVSGLILKTNGLASNARLKTEGAVCGCACAVVVSSTSFSLSSWGNSDASTFLLHLCDLRTEGLDTIAFVAWLRARVHV
jgi:hypothetical protein